MSLIKAIPTPTVTLFSESQALPSIIVSKPVVDVHLVLVIVGSVTVAVAIIVVASWYFIVFRRVNHRLDVSKDLAQGEMAKRSNVDLEAQTTAENVSAEAEEAPEAMLEIVVVPVSLPDQLLSTSVDTPAEDLHTANANANLDSIPPLPEVAELSVRNEEDLRVVSVTDVLQAIDAHSALVEDWFGPDSDSESEDAPEFLISAFREAVYDDDDAYSDDDQEDDQAPVPNTPDMDIDGEQEAESPILGHEALPTVPSQQALAEECPSTVPVAPSRDSEGAPAPDTVAPAPLISAFLAPLSDDDDNDGDDESSLTWETDDDVQVQIQTLDLARTPEVIGDLPSVQSQCALVEEWTPPAPPSLLQDEAPSRPERSPDQWASITQVQPASTSCPPTGPPRPPLVPCQPSDPPTSTGSSSITPTPDADDQPPSLDGLKKRKGITWAPDDELECVRFIGTAVYANPSAVRRRARMKASSRPTPAGSILSPSSPPRSPGPCSEKGQHPTTTLRRTPAIKGPARRPTSIGTVPASPIGRGQVGNKGGTIKRATSGWR